MDPDKSETNPYSGNLEEPQEDRSIIQADGTRACFNWECREGFGMLDLTGTHVVDAKTRKQLKKFGIPNYVSSVDDLLSCSEWFGLDEQRKVTVYEILERYSLK